MRKLSVLFFFLLFSFGLSAQYGDQPGWNWPEDENLKSQALEKQAYYKVLMQSDNKEEEALIALRWLYQNTPDLNESIYQDGAKILDKLLDKELTTERRSRLEDSLLWAYDMRIKYFDDPVAALDRKAYTAFKLYYKKPAKYSLLTELYGQLYEEPFEKISDFNHTPYMTVAAYYYKTKPKEFTATDVLDVHGIVTASIDEKISKGGNKTKLLKEQDKVDALLKSLGDDLISCEFIEENLVPKFNAEPNNINIAKKVFSYSLTAKCTDTDYFLKAGEIYMTEDPSPSLAKALGDKFYFSGQYSKAKTYYSKMEELSQTDDDKFEAFMGQASTEAKLGNKVSARSLARKALSVKPGAAEAYNLIGNLYFLSYKDCQAGKSRVDDRAVYIAAYDMYKKAGNTSQMQAAKEQFPSIEEIFNENREEGERVTVGCWINETVTLQRR